VKSLSESGISIDPAVEVAAERLAKLTGAATVALVGSRARGDHTAESDWDIFVVLPDDVEPGKFNSVTLWTPLSDLGIPLQVIPVRRSVFEARRADINSMSHDADRDGIVLHGSLAEI